MNWATILTSQEIQSHWDVMASHWPGEARKARSWWESRTLPQLHGRLAGAWDANELEAYVLARSYIAARNAAERAQA